MKSPHVFMLLALVLFGCTFSSEEEYFKDIPKPDGSLLSINLDSYNTEDTIVVYGPATFNFWMNGGDGVIKDVTISFGENQILHDEGNSFGQFTLYDHQLRTGTFNLKIEFTATTASGSLADKLSLERFLVSRKWVVKVDRTPPPTPDVTFAVENGYLKLTWPVYSKPNFDFYRITRIERSQYQTFDITDPQQNFWIDSSYVGGYPQPVEYYVSTTSNNGWGTANEFRNDPLLLNYTFNEDDTTVLVQWEPTPFYGAFKEYVISESNQVETIITDVQDTFRLIKLNTLKFGSSTYVSFEINSKTDDMLYYGFSYESFSIGKLLPNSISNRLVYNPALNSYMATDYSNLILLNDNFELDRTIETGKVIINIPYSGQFAYTFSYEDENLYQYDLINNTENANSILTGTSGGSRKGTSNGLICFKTKRRLMGNLGWAYTASVVRLADKKRIFFESGTTEVSATISDDGLYILATGKNVYKVVGDTAELVGPFLGSGRFVEFRRDKSEEMIIDDQGTIKIYDANTLNLLREIEPPTSAFSWTHYDPQTKFMLWTRSDLGKVYAVHIETEETIMIPAYYSSDYSIYLLNGYLITNGRYIKVLE